MPLEFVEQVTYTVQIGDTLSGIAAANQCTLEALIAANSGLVNDPSLIQVGWVLVVPGVLGGTRRGPAPAGEPVTSYTVQSGDTIGALAARWGTTVPAICELNGISNPSLIFVGQRIRRPGAGPEVAAASNAESVEASPPGDSVLVETRKTRLTFSRYPLDSVKITGGYRADYGGYLHRGIDLGGVPVGTPIHAPAPGILTVHRPGDGWGDGSFGICVVIDHPGTPWWSIYAHMNATDRASGETVTDGDVLGEIGFTGRVDPPGPAGAHLHWQLSSHSGFPPGFEYIANPLDFLAAP